MTWRGTSEKSHLHIQRHARQPAHVAVRIILIPSLRWAGHEASATLGGSRGEADILRRGGASSGGHVRITDV
jgi:hypothetical protein